MQKLKIVWKEGPESASKIYLNGEQLLRVQSIDFSVGVVGKPPSVIITMSPDEIEIEYEGEVETRNE